MSSSPNNNVSFSFPSISAAQEESLGLRNSKANFTRTPEVNTGNSELKPIQDNARGSFLQGIVENWEFIGHCILIIFAWAIISSAVVVFSFYVSAPITTLMFISSLLSMIASGLILMSGYYSGKKHRTVRSIWLQ
jgi:uncharacterized membrane protein